MVSYSRGGKNLKKYFGKLASVAIATTIVGGGFSINASASELESDAAANTYGISEVSESTLELTNVADEFTISVTFEPADGGIQTRDDIFPLFVGNKFEMKGSHHLLLYGSNAIDLKGNLAIGKNVGTAQVKAFKSNGDVYGVYTFDVKR